MPTYLGHLDKVRLARCIAEIRYISRAVDSYRSFLRRPSWHTGWKQESRRHRSQGNPYGVLEHCGVEPAWQRWREWQWRREWRRWRGRGNGNGSGGREVHGSSTTNHHAQQSGMAMAEAMERRARGSGSCPTKPTRPATDREMRARGSRAKTASSIPLIPITTCTAWARTGRVWNR